MAILLCAACAPTFAAKVARVEVRGLNPAMTDNVHRALGLEDSVGKTVSDQRLDDLVSEATDDTRKALEPFGYYSPVIRVTPTGERSALVVVIEVDKGQPVTIRKQAVGITGEAHDDPYMQQELAAFKPPVGGVLDHREYEGAKSRISRRLAERGYFDADFAAHRVEVTRAQYAADVDLQWTSGARYAMGVTTFIETPEEVVDPKLFTRLVYWNVGDYYHQGRLDRLRQSLVKLDYFSTIDIVPHPELATGNHQVPVTVTLVPAKRSIYTAGLSYGSVNGAGVLFGVERRYLNKRGHKALAQVDWAKKRKTATLQYRVPAFKWLDGWYTASLQFADENTDYLDTRRLEFVASRSGQFNRNLNLIASLHVLRERWAYPFEGAAAAPLVYHYANAAYPSLRADYVNVDDRMQPRKGFGLSAVVLAGTLGHGGGGFGQIDLRGRWFQGLGARDRLLVRGEVGRTFSNQLQEIPPSLRFYAGGQDSIRGYNWREVGPRVSVPKRKTPYALGAHNLMAGSVEYDHQLNASWGVAGFVDSGSAFDGRKADWHTGVGVGVRWQSPVGPVRIDIARGLKHPDSPFTLGVSLGPEL